MSVRPICYLTRKEHFSACHRLHSPDLDSETNKLVYGKCNNPNGHGHNYIVEVTLKGPVDLRTGMVMNITELKQHMDMAIMKPLDHKNLDKDVTYFKNVNEWQPRGILMNNDIFSEFWKEIYNKIKLIESSVDIDNKAKNTVSTTENVAIFIWDNLKMRLPRPELLHEVRILETDSNSVRYRGQVTNGRGMERRMSQNIIANMSSDSD